MDKVIVFGSARIDAFMDLPTDQTEQYCDIDTQRCMIELSYSAKLPLNDVQFLVGGNGANVAVGSKRQGIESVLVAELGQGPLADYAAKQLGKEIDMKYVSQTEGVNEGFGAVIVYQGERTILSYYSPERPPFPDDLGGSKWAYLTSVGDKFDGFYQDVYNWLEHHETRLVFNPGGRQIAKGIDWLKKYLEKTHLIMVNREEAQEIVRMEKTHGKEKELMDALHALGPKLVVVTDGPNGSFGKEGDKYYRLGTLSVDAIERTGAGDAYSTGCMTALIKGQSLSEAMFLGTLNANSVIGYVGPEDGLLRLEQVEEWTERARSMRVEVKEM